MISTPEQLYDYTMRRFAYNDTADYVTSLRDFSLNFTGTCIDCAAYLYAYLKMQLHARPTAWVAMNTNPANLTIHTWVTLPWSTGRLQTMEVAWVEKQGMHVYSTVVDMLMDYVTTLYPRFVGSWLTAVYDPLAIALRVDTAMSIDEYMYRLLMDERTTRVLLSDGSAYGTALRLFM